MRTRFLLVTTLLLVCSGCTDGIVFVEPDATPAERPRLDEGTTDPPDGERGGNTMGSGG